MSTNINTALQRQIIETKNMIIGRSDYTKFIILGRSRTGSNFLRGLLNDHKQVITYGEIFQNPDSLEWDHTGYLQSKKILQLLRNEPVTLIDKKIFRRYSQKTSAVGFKLFYYHAKNDNWKSIWDYLQNNTEIKVLHMKRKNLLKTHLSRKKAAITDRWVNTNGTKVEDRAILLDYQECLEDFQKTRHEEFEADNFFGSHQKLDVIYEELSSDYHQKMQQIQSFLNLPREDVHPATYQQSRLPLSIAIENYFELKEKFKGTEWAEFFEE